MFIGAGIGRSAPPRAAALNLPPAAILPRILRRPARLIRGLLLAMAIGLLAACATPPTVAPAPAPTLPPAPVLPPTPPPTVGVIIHEPQAAPGYILFSHDKGHAFYLIDRHGRIVHQWPLGPAEGRHARLLENGNLMVMGHGRSHRGGVKELDPQGRVVWQYQLTTQHHDFLPLPNGNILLLAAQRKNAAALRAFGGNPAIHPAGLSGTYLREIRPTYPQGGETVWEWSAWDHIIQDFDPQKPNYGHVADHPELIDLNFALTDERRWLHTNSVAYHPERDQIMLSVRHFSEIWIIDHSTTTEAAAGHRGGNSGRGGDILYRWGNPRAWQAGHYADQRLFLQHDAHWIPSGLPGAGNILLFNNGSGRKASPQRGYSSVDELTLPAAGYNYRRRPGTAYGPDQLQWTYANPAHFYSHAIGSAQRLPNGNTLFCAGTWGTIWEVTPAGATVWKYINPVQWGDSPARQGVPLQSHDPAQQYGNWVYRAYHYPPDYPGLAKLDLTPGATIELPPVPPP